MRQWAFKGHVQPFAQHQLHQAAERGDRHHCIRQCDPARIKVHITLGTSRYTLLPHIELEPIVTHNLELSPYLQRPFSVALTLESSY